MATLSELPNVGKVLEGLLVESGISTPEQLRDIGAQEAFIRIRTKDPTACIRMLYGLQGAVDGIRDTCLTENIKQELRDFYKTL